MIAVHSASDKLRAELADVARLFAPRTDDITVRHYAFESPLWSDCFRVELPGLRPSPVERSFTATPFGRDGLDVVRQRKRAAKKALYSLLKEAAGYAPPWGSLTGIRPTRIMYESLAMGLSLAGSLERMEREFDVSPAKAAVLGDIFDMQRGIIDTVGSDIGVYIGIPFCPTRCAYCSFASADLASGDRLTDPYVDALLRELRAVAGDMASLGRRARSIYVGGGTPTALSAAQLDRVLTAARECFPGAGELTVEAGRPDSIDRGKLAVIRASGAGRISINPQSMCDATLRAIGRRHTADQIDAAFAMAREAGFDNINADLIAALPGEGPAELEYTLGRIDRLAPESLTVHTLALKRSSALHAGGYRQADASAAAAMVDAAAAYAHSAGYRPYYLYRQKYMAGNLENIGYCKPGRQCVYNIDIMEETTPILAFGAGAISKWLYDRALRIERAPNVKNIEQYIARVDEMVERKRALYM